MKITPLLRSVTTTIWRNSHRLPLHNSGAIPPVRELFKWPSYIEKLDNFISCCSCAPHCVFMAWCLVRCGGNFTFTFTLYPEHSLNEAIGFVRMCKVSVKTKGVYQGLVPRHP